MRKGLLIFAMMYGLGVGVPMVCLRADNDAQPQMKATATAHSVSLTWTDPTGQPAGSGINLYRGSSAGNESSTPVNSTPVAIGVKSFTDTNVTANSTYFYVAKTCVGSVCSAPSNEVSATVPLAAGDLTPPSGLSSSAQ